MQFSIAIWNYQSVNQSVNPSDIQYCVGYHMALDLDVRINDAAMLLTQESQKYDPEVSKMSQQKLHSAQK